MKEIRFPVESILVLGSGKLAYSLTVCLLQAGHKVTLYTDQEAEAHTCIHTHLSDMAEILSANIRLEDLSVIGLIPPYLPCLLAIAVTNENLSGKKAVVQELEQVLPREALIAINTESIPLQQIQEGARHPERIIGANWVEPAHTTYFLEIITNDQNRQELVEQFSSMAKLYWQKDPYMLKSECGIRARLLAAMVREAFYLIENGYVEVEDIDRACRNDAGYYLPFAGNCRYMDLMGTYIYGIVMQDLNPELAKDRHLPAFFQEIIQKGGQGMENNRGFYDYQPGEVKRWEELSRTFSYQIQEIIGKYPFGYLAETAHVHNASLASGRR